MSSVKNAGRAGLPVGFGSASVTNPRYTSFLEGRKDSHALTLLIGSVARAWEIYGKGLQSKRRCVFSPRFLSLLHALEGKEIKKDSTFVSLQTLEGNEIRRRFDLLLSFKA